MCLLGFIGVNAGIASKPVGLWGLMGLVGLVGLVGFMGDIINKWQWV